MGSQYGGGLVGRAYTGAGIRSCFTYCTSLNINSNNNVSTTYRGALVGYSYATTSASVYCRHSLWFSTNNPTTWCASINGSTSYTYNVNNKSYTDSNLPKSSVGSTFYTSTNYLKDSGTTSTWSSSVWDRTNDNRAQKGYLYLKNSGDSCVAWKNQNGAQTISYGAANIQESSAITTKYTNSSTSLFFVYGQSISVSATVRQGYVFSHWGNDLVGTLSTSANATIIVRRKVAQQSVYAYFKGREYTINLNSNGGVISDMSLWNKYFYGETFKSISYDASSGLNTINFVGVGGWEIIGCPVQVSTNTSYTISFDYQVSSFTPLVSGGGLPIMVVSNIGGGTDETNGNLGAYSLGSYTISTTSSSVRRQSLTFNSGSYSTVYLVINFGHLMDSVNHTIKIGNFTREIGAVFNMTGKKIVQYGSTTGNTLSANAAKKRGYSQVGWYTAGSGGYQQYNSSGTYVSGRDNNYLSNFNNWTKHFHADVMTTSYNSNTKMSTFGCTGVAGNETLAIPLTVSTNTSYTFTFDYSAGSFVTYDNVGLPVTILTTLNENRSEEHTSELQSLA